jgi:hypothetical protein
MPFKYGEPVWVEFLRPLNLVKKGETFGVDRKDEFQGYMLCNYDVCNPEPKNIKLAITIESQIFTGEFPRNSVDITARPAEDKLPEFTISHFGLYKLCVEECWVECQRIKHKWHDLPLTLPLKSKQSSAGFWEMCERSIKYGQLYKPDQLNLRKLISNCKRLWLFGIKSDRIPDLYDIAGKLLCQDPWVKPWGSQGVGNVPFNPDQLFTYEHHWYEMLAALHWLPPVTPIEVDVEAWDYFLEVLPPLMMSCHFEWQGQTQYLSYVMGEGTPLTGGFYKNDKHYLVSVPANAKIWHRTSSKDKAVTASYLFYNR